MSYIEIDGAKFESFLVGLGFNVWVVKNEKIYYKYFDRNPNLVVKVYSSISVGEDVARACGEDAIRVVAVFDNGEKNFGIGKFSRVYRTGSQDSVHQRTLARIEEAFNRCAEWSDKNPARKESEHIGSLGENLRLSGVEVIRKKEWNDKFLFTMQDTSGNIFTYWTPKDVLQVGEKYDMRCVVSGFNTFAGVKQTIVTNCVGKRVIQ